MVKKPHHIKVVSGTDRPDRLSVPAVDLPPLNDVPHPPDWLGNIHAVKEWNRLAPILVANKLLSEGGLSALGNLCALHGQLVAQYSANLCPTASMTAYTDTPLFFCALIIRLSRSHILFWMTFLETDSSSLGTRIT